MEFLRNLDVAPLLMIMVLIALLFVSVAVSISTRADLNRLRNDYAALMEYLGNGEARDILGELSGLIRSIERDFRAQGEELSAVRGALAGCVQKVAVVRYNAFQSAGSDLSYSVALLDTQDDGVVLSGIYGREASTSYAKPIHAGVSEYILTKEEEEAIDIARRQYVNRPS